MTSSQKGEKTFNFETFEDICHKAVNRFPRFDLVLVGTPAGHRARVIERSKTGGGFGWLSGSKTEGGFGWLGGSKTGGGFGWLSGSGTRGGFG